MPKIAPTHEIAPFCSKNEEKYTERWSRRKKRMQKEMLNPIFVVVNIWSKNVFVGFVNTVGIFTLFDGSSLLR